VPQVVGVKFRSGPKTYHFDCAGLAIQRGSKVVAETTRGPEIGQVTTPPRDIPDGEISTPLKPLLRIAEVSDILQSDRIREKETQAYDFCLKRIRERGLPMKLVEAHYAFDESKVTFYFTSEGRVDFRELLKDLNAQFRMKVHLFQIGARDAARIIGGIGPCGQELCCSRWLTSFESVSMKMAKDQSLFLNPSKFSGVCGKLMCCLRYEHETYLLTRKAMPGIGSQLETPYGVGTVVELIVPKESALVEVPERGLVEVKTPVKVQAEQPRCRGGGGCSASSTDGGGCGSGDCGSCGGCSAN
jgi:cell fate regulator YaaT (PSP1 superfamily)